MSETDEYGVTKKYDYNTYGDLNKAIQCVATLWLPSIADTDISLSPNGSYPYFTVVNVVEYVSLLKLYS